jgi:hypothetical protein
MDDAGIFHEAMAGEGGRLDTSAIDPTTAAGLDHAARRARGFLQSAAEALPGMPPIHFDYVDSWDFNAVAFGCKGRYFIGVYRGAVATLALLFDRMLADREVLPFVGSPQEEAAVLPLLPDIGTNYKRTVASVPTFPGPQDPARRATARKLTELTLDFLTAHEFAHVANRHVDFASEKLGVSAIQEVGGAPRTPDGTELPLINQTMEMDADGTAVMLSLGSEWGKVAGSFPRPGPPWTEFYGHPGMVSLQWSWAVSSLFRVFGEARLADEDDRKSHPPPRLRSVMAHQAAGRVPRPPGLGTHSALVGDEAYGIPPSVRAGGLDVEGAFSRLTGRPDATEGLDDAWGDAGESQARRLRMYWRTTLKRELLGFAHQPLGSYGGPDRGPVGSEGRGSR